MNREEKLKNFISKEDYNVAVENAPYSPLPQWYLEILNKSLKELSDFDLIRCIRQEIFADKAVYEIVQRMIDSATPLYADYESVEIMEKLSSVDSAILNKYCKELNQILNNMFDKNQMESFEIWVDDEEKEEFLSYIDRLKQKIA